MNTPIGFDLIGAAKDALVILKVIEIAVGKRLNMQIHLNKSGVKHHTLMKSYVLYIDYRGNYDARLNYEDTQHHIINGIKFSVPTKRLLKRIPANC